MVSAVPVTGDVAKPDCYTETESETSLSTLCHRLRCMPHPPLCVSISSAKVSFPAQLVSTLNDLLHRHWTNPCSEASNRQTWNLQRKIKSTGNQALSLTCCLPGSPLSFWAMLVLFHTKKVDEGFQKLIRCAQACWPFVHANVWIKRQLHSQCMKLHELHL